MAVCPRCGEENPERARFCMVCAEPLGAGGPRREERKVVSILFVDLVGFTAASEAADPEDVRARLQGYHARAKAEVERFGGTVEKFVGDAVMAAFGAPVAHEDDAERAVRAGLAILEALEGLELEARAAVNTGEAVVALDARPELGEGIVTGDVVNTAARLQSSAPARALVAGEQTYWATRHAIDYEQLEPVSAKGKAEPVPLWHALGARSRLGVDVEPSRSTPFLGRDDELEVLRQVYARTLRESECHLVTLVGEPGIGKSRLVAELAGLVDSRPEIVFWRQGPACPTARESRSGRWARSSRRTLGSSSRTIPRRRGRSSPACSSRSCRARTSRRGSPANWPASSAPEGPAARARGPSPPGAPSWRRSRRSGRS